MTLYLLPNVLASDLEISDFLPISVQHAVENLDGLIAESEGEGRRYLKRFQTKKPPYQMPIALMNEKVDFLLEPLLKGENWGVVSDAGLPCLADPGTLIVKRARALNIPIKAFVGPSSIFLALMQSGLNGQHFFFHGYIPKKPNERKKSLLEWQKIREVTHIFIEAPYRNVHTFNACLEVLEDSTQFCVATHLTAADQRIETHSIKNWRKNREEIPKKPTIFLFSAT